MYCVRIGELLTAAVYKKSFRALLLPRCLIPVSAYLYASLFILLRRT